MECLQELESTFDYGKELQKQRAVAAVKLREIKAPQSALHLESRAEVVAEGRGNTAWRTIEDTSDWLEVEKLVRGFAAMGRKQMRVSWTTTYGVPPPGLEEGGSDEDDKLSGDEEHPTQAGTGTSSTRRSPTPTPLPGLPAKKKTRQTAMVVEVEKARLVQAKEKNWIPELMERWRCTIPRCHLYEKGACLIFPGESQCRSMNAAILGQWNDLIQRGEAQVGCFPVDKMKIPPLKGGGKEATPGPATPLTGLTHTPNIFFGYPPNFLPSGSPNFLPSGSIARSQTPLEYQTPSTPAPTIPKSPVASQLCQLPSSPAI